MIVIGFDPGEMTGVGVLKVNGDHKMKLVRSATFSRADLYSKLAELLEGADVVVVEDFKVRPNNARRGSFDWSHLVPVQVIGAIHYESSRLGKPTHFQQPNLKPVGYSFLGKQYVKGAKNVHHLDALAHAAYYLVKNKYAEPNGKSVPQSKTG